MRAGAGAVGASRPPVRADVYTADATEVVAHASGASVDELLTQTTRQLLDFRAWLGQLTLAAALEGRETSLEAIADLLDLHDRNLTCLQRLRAAAGAGAPCAEECAMLEAAARRARRQLRALERSLQGLAGPRAASMHTGLHRLWDATVRTAMRIFRFARNHEVVFFVLLTLGYAVVRNVQVPAVRLSPKDGAATMFAQALTHYIIAPMCAVLRLPDLAARGLVGYFVLANLLREVRSERLEQDVGPEAAAIVRRYVRAAPSAKADEIPRLSLRRVNAPRTMLDRATLCVIVGILYTTPCQSLADISSFSAGAVFTWTRSTWEFAYWALTTNWFEHIVERLSTSVTSAVVKALPSLLKQAGGGTPPTSPSASAPGPPSPEPPRAAPKEAPADATTAESAGPIADAVHQAFANMQRDSVRLAAIAAFALVLGGTLLASLADVDAEAKARMDVFAVRMRRTDALTATFACDVDVRRVGEALDEVEEKQQALLAELRLSAADDAPIGVPARRATRAAAPLPVVVARRTPARAAPSAVAATVEPPAPRSGAAEGEAPRARWRELEGVLAAAAAAPEDGIGAPGAPGASASAPSEKAVPPPVREIEGGRATGAGAVRASTRVESTSAPGRSHDELCAMLHATFERLAENEWAVSPFSGRHIRKGGSTYDRLVRTCT